MSGINSLKPVVNFFVSSVSATKYVTKPKSVSLFKTEINQLKPVFDTFERRAKFVSIDEVKKLFPTGKLDEKNYLIREMRNVLSRVEPMPKHVIDLSPILTERDYKLITDMMNLHNGKYIDVWKGFSDTDLIPNIEKLALFNRSMKLSKQADDFLQFNPEQWDVIVEGIVRKPKDAIVPLLEYKVNSDEINRALSSGEITADVQKKIDAITNYLNLFETKKDLTVYRGEKSFGLLKRITYNEKNLGDEIENLTQKIEANLSMNNYDENEVLNFIENNLVAQWCNQSRFMSTAMTQKAADKYAQKILWKIKVPAGTKGASIESFNIEREAEAEFLLQRGSNLLIKNAKFNPQKRIWEINAVIEPINIDIGLNNVKMRTGV